MANANIFSQYLQPVRSPLDFASDLDRRDLMAQQLVAAQRSNELGGLQAQQVRSQMDQRNALRDAVQSGRIDLTNPAHASQALAIAPDVAGALLKTVQEGQTSAALAQKDLGAAQASRSSAGKTDWEVQSGKYNRAISDISSFATPQDALDALQRHQKAGDVSPDQVAAITTQLQSIQSGDVGGFQQMRRQMLMAAIDAKDRAEMEQKQALANQTNATTIRGQDLTANTSTATNAATNKTHLAGIGIQQQGENLRAGFLPNGQPTGDMETTAQAIAKGQLPPPTGIALLNPKNQRILSRVMEINPQYDFSTITAKKAAATSFATGPLGNALRSVSTANAHLDQLGELADAMNNKDTQVINKVGNYFAVQTGDPSVTNFDSIKNIVGQEVVKAIVAGGGSAGERDEAAKTFSNASSPAQIKGAIQHYRMVMKAQADNLMEQRRAAGLPDSTLPNYNAASATTSTVPPDIQKLLDKHGGK